MRNTTAFIVAALCYLISASASHAYPTGAPLSHFAVQPCRILDTRVAIGPLQPLQALNVYVRGSNLQGGDAAPQGASHADCDVPSSAEVAVVNITAVSPTTGGNLVLNASGSFPYPRGTVYSRLNFVAGHNVANEMNILLCNASAPGFPHVPCVHDGMGLYRDFLVWSVAPTGSTVHVVGDVVGYFARPLP